MRAFMCRVAALLALSVAAVSPPALAHELTMAEITLRELSPGQFVWNWGAAGAGGKPVEEELVPRWPEPCREDGQQLICVGGLIGTLSIEGVGRNYSAAMVRITWLDGQRRVYTITESQPGVQLYGAADDSRGAREISVAYTVLGIEHILGGIDHVLFVICLLFLVGFNR
ncbi:MAG TPA: hypothetical protein VMK82_03405, partial [Steroidobacteraceae bacterium]|nr:hypothetical protein [Steroidobacteraceae bacterium]